MLGGPCVQPGRCPWPGNWASSCNHKKAANQERTAGRALRLFLALARMSCQESTKVPPPGDSQPSLLF